MHYDQFVGQIQHRARLSSTGDAVAAIRATLETLAERLAGGEAKDLASQLPREIGYYLKRGIPELPQRFGLDEFVWRVSMREGVDPRRAFFHARVVMEVVSEAVSIGEMEDVINQLPPDFAPLFEPTGIREAEQRRHREPGRGMVRQRRGPEDRGWEEPRRQEGPWRESRTPEEESYNRGEPPRNAGRGMGSGEHGSWAEDSGPQSRRDWATGRRGEEQPRSQRQRD